MAIGGPCQGRPGRGTWGEATAKPARPGTRCTPLAGVNGSALAARGSRAKKRCQRPAGCPPGQRQRALGLSLAAPKRGDLAWGRSPSPERSGGQPGPRSEDRQVKLGSGLPAARRGTPRGGLPPRWRAQPERQRKSLIEGVQPSKQGHFSAEKRRSRPVVKAFTRSGYRPRRYLR